MPRVTEFRQVTVGTNTIQIVPYKEGRSGLLIRNYSGSQVFISTDSSSLISTGYPVNVGEFFNLLNSDGDASELQVYAQCASGTADLRIVESYGETK
jgi:hypothetical protein